MFSDFAEKKMVRKIRTYKTSIAIGLLLSFGSIFICDYLCDLGIIFPKHDHSSSQTAKVQHLASNHNHDHHSGHEHNHGQNNIHADDHHHDGSGEAADDCCEDLTYPFYASLSSSIVKKVSLPDFSRLLSYLVISFENIQLTDNSHIRKTPVVYYNLPPPGKGYFIRILIQSFLN